MRLLGALVKANWAEYGRKHKLRVAQLVRHGEVHHRPLFGQRQQQWQRHRLRKCSTTGPSSEPHQPALHSGEQQPDQQQQQQQRPQGAQQEQQPLQWQHQAVDENGDPGASSLASEPANQPPHPAPSHRQHKPPAGRVPAWVAAVMNGQWLLQPQPPPLVPPWGLSLTVTLMAFWMIGFWLAASSGVPVLVGLLGLDAAGGSARVKAFKHLLLDVFQLLLTLGTLWLGLRQYSPRSLGFFSFSLRPWRSWLAPLLAGLASFPVVDWVYKHLIAWLNLGDNLLAGTVEEIATTSDWGAHVVWFAVLAICAPVWEEIMFRGFLLPSLTKYLPRWGAVLASALVFSMVHFTKDGFLPLLLLGLVFGAVYVQTRNLWPPVLLHAVWNVILLQQIRASGTGL